MTIFNKKQLKYPNEWKESIVIVATKLHLDLVTVLNIVRLKTILGGSAWDLHKIESKGLDVSRGNSISPPPFPSSPFHLWNVQFKRYKEARFVHNSPKTARMLPREGGRED